MIKGTRATVKSFVVKESSVQDTREGTKAAVKGNRADHAEYAGAGFDYEMSGS